MWWKLIFGKNYWNFWNSLRRSASFDRLGVNRVRKGGRPNNGVGRIIGPGQWRRGFCAKGRVIEGASGLCRRQDAGSPARRFAAIYWPEIYLIYGGPAKSTILWLCRRQDAGSPARRFAAIYWPEIYLIYGGPAKSTILWGRVRIQYTKNKSALIRFLIDFYRLEQNPQIGVALGQKKVYTNKIDILR